ncbi:MAG: hypothetical protein LBN02_03500 [Oscillospiraceae bacterium]|jgi:hypothetical protein|nr:hypothetical protein [Oscillospiraceae bacterium]
MEQKSTVALDGFDTVWERVTDATGNIVPVNPVPTTTIRSSRQTKGDDTVVIPTPSDPSHTTPAQDAAALGQIIDRLAEVYRTCCELGKRCHGAVGATCRALAESARSSVRNLQAQYYIITGERYVPGGVSVPPTSLADALREVINLENANQIQLARLAETTTSPTLARACLCEEQQCAKRTCVCQRLLVKCGLGN